MGVEFITDCPNFIRFQWTLKCTAFIVLPVSAGGGRSGRSGGAASPANPLLIYDSAHFANRINKGRYLYWLIYLRRGNLFYN